MARLTKISVEQLKPYIEIAFKGDTELLGNLHISPGTLEHCVEHTYSFIKENSEFYKEDLECYIVSDFNKHIGFTVVVKNEGQNPILKNELYSFGISVNDRCDRNKNQWLAEIKRIIGDHFVVLHAKNVRAINFFEKKGYKIYRETKYLNDATKTLLTSKIQ